MEEKGQRRRIVINGERVEIEVLSLDRSKVSFIIGGRRYDAGYEQSVPLGADSRAETASALAQCPVPALSGTSRSITAPIPGVVAALLVAPGDHVTSGDVLLRLDAMKMENNIIAPQAGTVRSISVTVGAEVCDGQALIELDV